MKHIFLYGLAISSCFLFSCSREEMPNNIIETDNPNVITLESVTLNDFSSDTSSRASYTQDAATVFEQDDKLGLILLDAEGNRIDHLSYSYISAENRWNLDDQSKYYSSKIKKIIAYFPYNSSLSAEINTIDELKNTISISTDQSDQNTFKSCDLLVEEINSPSQKLTVNLEHAFSLIEFRSEPMNLQANNKSYEYNVKLQNVKMVIDDIDYQLCNINGTYSLLVKDKFSIPANDFRYFYSFEDNSYVKTLTTSKTTKSGTKYVFPCKIEDGYKPGYAVGDFYCTDNSNENVVIVPKVVTTIPEGLTCQGIVFYTMNQATFESYASTNSLTAKDYPGYNSNHGLIISLKDGGPLGSASSFENFLLRSIEGWNNKESLNGYKITQAMQEAVKDGTITSFTALNNHEEPASSATTSWFAPSFKELSILIRGGDGTTATGEGRAYINQQLQEIGGTTLGEGNIPSITFEESPTQQNIVWFVTGKDGAEFSYPFTNTTPGESFRPICAF